MRVTTPARWTVRAVGGDVPDSLAGRVLPATVPGCVHLDLLAAGVIPDPYHDENEQAVAWIGRVDWRYECELDRPGADDTGGDGGVCEIVADGLDTFAEVALNGRVVARARNMHRSHRFDVTAALHPGRNSLSVTFAAPVPTTRHASEELGPLPHANTHPYNAARKMACNYGWDWGPDLATSGIWRPLRLECWDGARIAAVRPLVDVVGPDGVLTTHVDVARVPGCGPLEVELRIDGATHRVPVAPDSTSATIEAVVPDARIWWPHGYGDQHLYDVHVRLLDGHHELHTWHGRVGFRTIRLDTTPDTDGVPFRLVVNGAPVFARGVNWIPDDCFPSRVTRDRYAQRLTQARDAHVNLVRVWGGGIYESDDFYDLCDELGLLVWQDFLFACAAYTEEEPLRSEVEAEAREAVTRLSPHPSLVLWNGGNENIWGYVDWDWRDAVAGRSWGWGYYTGLLPDIVAEVDPSRPYSPGSPFSFSPGAHPNEPSDGTVHIWDVWNERDYTAYADYVPRFAAEFGFQGPPTWSTLVDAVHDDPLTPDSPGIRAHQKAEDGGLKLARGLEPHLPEPRTFEDWHWATSLNQARAIRFALEHFRSWSPVCAGAIVWQLNDCWPVTSWATVDGAGRRKPAWFALRDAFADRLLTLQPRDGRPALVAVNDSAAPWVATARVARLTHDGVELAAARVPFEAPARGTATLAIPVGVTTAGRRAGELLRATVDDGHAWWHYTEDVEGALPEPVLDAEVEHTDGGFRLHVTARSLLRDLALLVDRLDPDAVVDRMLVTLLPGEAVTFEVTSTTRPRLDEITDPGVLRCSNQLVSAAEVRSPAAP